MFLVIKTVVMGCGSIGSFQHGWAYTSEADAKKAASNLLLLYGRVGGSLGNWILKAEVKKVAA